MPSPGRAARAPRGPAGDGRARLAGNPVRSRREAAAVSCCYLRGVNTVASLKNLSRLWERGFMLLLWEWVDFVCFAAGLVVTGLCYYSAEVSRGSKFVFAAVR